MKTKRAIVLGVIIWCIGIFLYSLSYYVPILENPEAQANLVLFAAVMPLVWLAVDFIIKKIVILMVIWLVKPCS